MAMTMGQREALQTIIRESERMRNIAKAHGNDYLAFLLEQVLHEARATLVGAGEDVPTVPDGATIVEFKPR
jgi:hypothetical protein